MGPYRIIITPRFTSDLTAIRDFIAKNSPDNAARMAERILEALETLRTEPHHNLVQGGDKRLHYEARTLPVKPYVVYYDVIETEKVVRIIHVRHGAQRPPNDIA